MALIRKRRLTEQQQRRIQKQQKTRQEDIDTSSDLEGLVVQHYGRQLEVQALSIPDSPPIQPPSKEGDAASFWKNIDLGSVWRCHTRTNLDLLVTGDRVKWQADPNTGLGIITAIHPRRSLLTRPDRYHKVKPVAANISLIVIVIAPLPEPAPSLIDRYLVACADADIPALILLNKTDLLIENDPRLNCSMNTKVWAMKLCNVSLWAIYLRYVIDLIPKPWPSWVNPGLGKARLLTAFFQMLRKRPISFPRTQLWGNTPPPQHA